MSVGGSSQEMASFHNCTIVRSRVSGNTATTILLELLPHVQYYFYLNISGKDCYYYIVTTIAILVVLLL